MKLCFSTLGCPSWSFDEVFAGCKDLGFDGVEIRGVKNVIMAPALPEFSPTNAPAVKKRLQDAGLQIPIFTSGAVLSDQSTLPSAMKEAMEYVMLASRMGAPYIRVLGEANPAPTAEVDEPALLRAIAYLCDFALPYHVTVLIETNGRYACSENMLYLLETISRENLGVLWDIHHPYRFFGEKPAYTARLLGNYVRHVHVKDSVSSGGAVAYRILGEGDLPIAEFVTALQDTGYDGFLSLEWVKRWSANLAEPSVVFPQYKSYMSHIIGR